MRLLMAMLRFSPGRSLDRVWTPQRLTVEVYHIAEVSRDRAALLWPRYTTMSVLGELGGTRAIETLRQIALDDFEEEGVRLQAVTALGRT